MREEVIFIYTTQGFKKIRLSEISYMEIFNKTVTIHAADGASIVSGIGMDILLEHLGTGFMKVNETQAVSVKRIHSILNKIILLQEKEISLEDEYSPFVVSAFRKKVEAEFLELIAYESREFLPLAR